MIGVAGGVGPLAGVDVCRKIIAETKASCDQEHLPLLLYSLAHSIPDRTRYLLGEEKENPALMLSEILIQLEKAGATVAAIPCNTAHSPLIFDVILQKLHEAGSRLKVLHMINETISHLKTISENAGIGVLSTNGTRATGVYRNSLSYHGFRVIEPEESLQQQIHDAIYNTDYGIKSHSSPVNPYAVEVLNYAVSELVSQGADILLLGCSELPLAITNTLIHDKPVIDPNLVLARALIKNYLETRSL